MKDWAQLLKAIAALLWPVFAFVVLLLYRDQLRRVLDRFRRGKFLGQELELEAIAADAKTRPLASAVASESLDALLTSQAFREKISAIVASASDKDREDVAANVVDTVKSAASESLKKAFVKVDTRPFLGRRGDVWEEPYEEGLTVRKFLDRIWFEMSRYVKPFRYPDGWVLRDPIGGRLFTDIGRDWARQHGQAEDDRRLGEVGIQPGAAVEVVPGPKVQEALVPTSILK
jgi:hypothetical protein